MWSNLGNKLGSTDWNAALQKIGDAVAPLPGDEGSEYDSEEEYESEEEGDFEDQSEDEDQGKRNGLGLVGILARAMEPAMEPMEAADVPSMESTTSALPNDAQQFVAGEPNESIQTDFPGPMKTSSKIAEKTVASLDSEGGQSMPAPKYQNTSMKTHTRAAANFDGSAKSDTVQEQVVRKSSRNIRSRLDLANDKQRIPAESKMGIDPVKAQKLKPPEPDRLETQYSATSRKQGAQPTVRSNLGTSKAQRPQPNIKVTTGNSESSVHVMPPCAREPGYRHKDKPSLPKTDTLTTNNSVPEKPTPPTGKVPANKLSRSAVEDAGSTRYRKEQERIQAHHDVIPTTGGSLSKSSSTEISNNSQLSESRRLAELQAEVETLKNHLKEAKKSSEQSREEMMIKFQEKEARILTASNDEFQHELHQVTNRYEQELQALQTRFADERNRNINAEKNLKAKVEATQLEVARAHARLEEVENKHNQQITRVKKESGHSVLGAEEKLAKALALLDERKEETDKLKTLVQRLQSSMDEHAEGVEEAEQEVEELQDENEGLQEHVDALEKECLMLREKVSGMETTEEKLSALQLKMAMLLEERDREKAKIQSAHTSNMNLNSQIQTERDVAVAELRDIKQQLTAVIADCDIERADKERVLVANSNLQSALEVFQDERQTEINLTNEQRLESEKALESAHHAAIDILKETYEEQIRQLRSSASSDIATAKSEVEGLREALEQARSDNGQLRRSLDEAIHRLQATQEDVIDRTLMKNILLDWCRMKEKDKRHQVLQMMASVLNFSEEEKESVRLTHIDVESVKAKVVGALAAPLPPSKTNVDSLQGDNVSEKWVNFLLSETDDNL